MRTIYIMDECRSSRNNGIGTYIRELISCLSNTDYKVIKLNFNADVNELEIDICNDYMSFPQFTQGNFIDNYEAISAILSFHITDSTDNVFIMNHSPCNNLLITMKEVFPLSKFIFVIHDMCWCAPLMGDHKLLRSIEDSTLQHRIKQEKEMFDVVDYIVCLNNDTYSVLRDFYNIDTKNKVYIIYNGLTPNTINYNRRILRRELYLCDNNPVALFVGRLTQAKGLQVLTDAFEIVLQAIPEMYLVLAGHSDPFFSQVEINRKIPSRIIYTGHISPEELEKWYAVSDIGVIPSYSEQCSFVAIEMMMHGMAIVYADSFGLRCMFKDCDSGYIALRDQNFAENLASSIINLVNNTPLRQRLQKNSFNNYTNRYSITVMRQNYLAMFDALYNKY